MGKNRAIEITLEDGKKVDGKILFTFEANGDNFILYELNKKAFSAKINDDNKLSPIEKDEWALVEKLFEEFMQSLEMEEDE